MSNFFYIDDNQINFDDLSALVKDEFQQYFGRKELDPYILSEVCVLDMIYAVINMKDGYFKDKLVLKGGLSVRNHVPLIDHRFSYDADFNANSHNGFTYRHVSMLRKELAKFGSQRGCRTAVQDTRNSVNLHFIEVGYWDALKNDGWRIVERPKIEICKTCRVMEPPSLRPMSTIIDLEIMGLAPPEVAHLSLEEQFACKLYTIGAGGRQRNHFDAYDAMRIARNNKLDYKLAKKLFGSMTAKQQGGTRVTYGNVIVNSTRFMRIKERDLVSKIMCSTSNPSTLIKWWKR